MAGKPLKRFADLLRVDDTALKHGVTADFSINCADYSYLRAYENRCNKASKEN